MSKFTLKNNSVTDNSPDYKQAYTEGAAGNAGAYKINNRTGRLDFSKELFATDGERMPLGLTLTYNPYLSAAGVSPLIPGWKLNYEQFVHSGGINLMDYVDGNYRSHMFVLLYNDNSTGVSRNVYYDTDHTGLIMYVYADRTEITDNRGTTLRFEGGKLVSITEKRGSATTVTTINRTDNALTVTDGMGRQAALTKSANTYSLTLPGGRTINMELTPGQKLKITDFSGEVCEYTYAYGTVKNLTGITSSYGDYADISFDGSNRVENITVGLETNGEKNGIKKYALVYNDGTTDVSDIYYPSDLGDGYAIETRYTFAANGEIMGSYERKNERTAAVRFRSQEDYRRYNVKVSSEDYAKGYYGPFGLGDTEELTVPIVSRYNNNTAELNFSLPDWTAGDDFVLSFTGEVINPSAGGTHTVAITGLGQSRECSFDNAPGAQARAIKISIKEDEMQYLGMLKMNFENAGSMKFSNLALVKAPKGEDIACVNVNTGSGFDYSDGSSTWYELSDCLINGTGNPVTMTGEDWKQTLENYARRGNDGNFIVWFNDKGGARLGSANTFVTFGSDTVHRALSSISYATVSLRGTRESFETCAYGSGNSYVTITEKTKFADGTKKTCYSYYNQYYNLAETKDSKNTRTLYEYDAYGNVKKVTKLNGSLKTVTEREYGEKDAAGAVTVNGRYLLAEKSYLKGETCAAVSDYDLNTGDVTASTSPKNHQTSYSYRNDRLPEEIFSSVGTTENKNAFAYVNGKLDKITHNGFDYAFAYDVYGDVETFRLKNESASQLIIKKSYSHVEGTTATSYCAESLANRYTPFEQKIYNEYGQLTNVTKMSEGTGYANARFLYGAVTDAITDDTQPFDPGLTKNADSKLRRAIDNGERTLYNYTAAGQLRQIVKRTLSTDYAATNDYDEEHRLVSENISGPGATLSVTYAYENGDAMNDDRIKSSVTDYQFINTPTKVTVSDTTDGFGRLQTRQSGVVIQGYRLTNPGKSYSFSTSYTYAAGRSGETTGFVETENITFPDLTQRSNTYSYDKNGNIAGVSTGGKNVRYTYDGLNRLIREDNQNEAKTWTYEYDAGGNRRSKKEYAYTLAENPGTPSVTTAYAYDGTWHDRLTAITVNGAAESIGGYGGEGCPTSYRGAALTWKNGLLNKFVKNGVTTGYEYKSDNVRLRKTGNVTADYC